MISDGSPKDEHVICRYFPNARWRGKSCDDYPEKCSECIHNTHKEEMSKVVIKKISYFKKR